MRDHIFVANGTVFQERFYCIATEIKLLHVLPRVWLTDYTIQVILRNASKIFIAIIGAGDAYWLFNCFEYQAYELISFPH